MDKARFEALIAAYGADPRRWPAAERAEAQAFATREGVDLSEARSLDALLDHAPQPAPLNDLLAARILAARKRSRNVGGGAVWTAMAACMVGGVLLGVGAGLNAPAAAQVQDAAEVDEIIAIAFDAPFEGGAP